MAKKRNASSSKARKSTKAKAPKKTTVSKAKRTTRTKSASRKRPGKAAKPTKKKYYTVKGSRVMLDEVQNVVAVLPTLQQKPVAKSRPQPGKELSKKERTPFEQVGCRFERRDRIAEHDKS